MIFFISLFRYTWWLKRDNKTDDPDSHRLYLTVSPDNAIDASRLIRKYADEQGMPKRIMNRISLCMEEMVFYAAKTQKNRHIRIQVEILISNDKARFMMLDDGECISLDENPETKEIITNNYQLMTKIAKTIQYQYILDMNYSILTF